MHIEAVKGMTCTVEDLEQLSDVSSMPGALPRHYLGQADRSILEAADTDLILIDTWADMNFELWRSERDGWTCWIHPKFLRDREGFNKQFKKMGRRTFDQSVEDCAKLVDILREKNPMTPVVFLNQQTDYYPKMDGRREYYEFGRVMQRLVPNSYFGGIISKEDLEPADIGSCGAGMTLHFQGSTYASMIQNALKNGLADKADSGPATPAVPYAMDNKDRVDYPLRQVSFDLDEDGGCETCGTTAASAKSLENYIAFTPDVPSLRWTPVVIDLIENPDYSEWERAVNKRYDRVRMKRRSERIGNVVLPFHPKLYIPDTHQIHHSATVRSGGTMRGDYLKTIEEMGGYPTQYYVPAEPKCARHWGKSMGVFRPREGHKQGEIVVEGELLGYINLRRIGDVLVYSRIMGHADHLNDGVMYQLHFDIVRSVMTGEMSGCAGLKYIMYGGIGNGGPNLWQWKRTVGFVPYRLAAFPVAG